MDREKREFYKSLVHLPFGEAGRAIGLGEWYKEGASLRAVSAKLYHFLNKDEVLEELGISKDVAELVRKAVEERRLSRGNIAVIGNKEPEKFESADVLDPSDTKGVVLGGRNKALMLLHKKMDRLMKSNKKLDEVSVSQLATMFGIIFDKAQILQGQATENIALKAHIKDDMSPTETLDALLQMREAEARGS